MNIVIGLWAVAACGGCTYLFLEMLSMKGTIKTLRKHVNEQAETIDKLVAVVGGGESTKLLAGDGSTSSDTTPQEWDAFFIMLGSLNYSERLKTFRAGKNIWHDLPLDTVTKAIDILSASDRDNAFAYYIAHRVGGPKSDWEWNDPRDDA